MLNAVHLQCITLNKNQSCIKKLLTQGKSSQPKTNYKGIGATGLGLAVGPRLDNVACWNKVRPGVVKPSGFNVK